MVPIHKLSGRLGNSMFQLAYLYNQVKLGIIPDIYVQDPCYFEESRDEVKALFGSNIAPIDQVAIHVRRGDYCKNSFYINLMEDTDYYEQAMALFPQEKFLVFSDNIDWCKQQPIFSRCEFSEGNTDVEDMNLMAGCKAVITANSSFSWWAGFLSKGTVIYPSQWYSDNKQRTLCPSEWIKI